MKQNFTPACQKLSILSLLLIFFSCASVTAQINVAPSSTVTQTSTAPPCGSTNTAYNTCYYTDNVIQSYSLPSATTSWSFVTTGGTITFKWTSATQPPVTVNRMVFYKEFRPMVSAEIEYAFGGVWMPITGYNNYMNNIADSITFPAVTADSIRIKSINTSATGGLVSPNFREIQIWNMPDCFGTPFTNIQATYNGTTVFTPANVAFNNVCPSAPVALNATVAQSSVGHGYQWQVAASGAGPWTSIAGATGPGYIAYATGDLYYRVVDTCTASGLFAASSAFRITKSTTVYNTIPYSQHFEPVWTTSACAIAPFVRDLPAPGWGNTYASGNNSWRIDSIGWPVPPGTIAGTSYTSGWGNVNTGYYPGQVANKTARAHTSQMLPGAVGNLDLYLNLSAITGDKHLYFKMLNLASGVPGGDSLRVLLSTDDGLSWTQLAGYDTAAAWRWKNMAIQSNSATAIIRFQSHRKAIIANPDASDIGLDSLFVVGPCNGMPNAGTIGLASPTQACAGAQFTLSPNGTTMAGGLVYTWEKLINGCVTPDANVGGTGANTAMFTTPPIYDTICYRLKVRCGNDSAYTNTITFNVPEPQYASIPFTENFESWMTKCATSTVPAACATCTFEVPSIYWANTPVTGNNSWRKNIDAATAGWAGAVNGPLTNLPSGYAARFHSAAPLAVGVTGSLDLFVNCSSSLGTKELHFKYENEGGTDSLRIWMSTNGGMTFTKLTSFSTTGALTWVDHMVPIASNSATTVIRFQGWGDGTTHSDIGVDKAVVLPPCTGAPNPGTISTAAPCPGVNFTIGLQGSSQAAGLTYQWYKTTDTTTGWTLIPGATNMNYTDAIFQGWYYKVEVTCNNSTQVATTPTRYIPIAAFYYCYCASGGQSSLGADIGNFTVSHVPSGAIIFSDGTATPVINNSGATATYTDKRWPIKPLIPMYHDSTYRLVASQINSGAFTPATVSVWLDMDHNGVFDIDERILYEGTSSAATQAIDSFFVPDSLPVGITGMRVVMETPQNANPDPCAIYTGGETEDYLVDIRYHPCDGPADAGIAFASDTSSCPNYLVTLYDTSHVHKLHNIDWIWQYSPDGFSWANVPGSAMKDTIDHILTGQTFFRLRMVCNKTFSFDTTYSNEVKISINPPYACYCFSLANGGTLDSSDLGAFTLIMTPDTFSINLGGPHLLNNEAYRSRTDYTKAGDIELYTNGSYPFLFYHIMRGSVHADAKITMFMDFNNDLEYDINPPYNERVFTGYATANNFVVTGTLTIPPFAIPNVRSGMRIIINNDIGPNVQSDSACGPYTSGETEDYVVVFRDSNLSAGTIKNVTQLYLYPNPSDGRFNITFTAISAVEKATVTVTNVLGQVMMEKQYANAGKQFTKDIDLSGVAKGVYLVELKADNERIVRRLVIQ